MPGIVRESKSAATIRRRRQKSSSPDIPLRHKAHHADDNFDFSEEDPEPPMEEPQVDYHAIKLIMSSERTLFLGLVAFRFINALTIQTSYVPDEYWQSIEVAHKMAYGYGFLTWEWDAGLRGYSYPMIFAVIYKILGILHLDARILLIKLPRIIQGIMAATGDLYLFKLSRKLSGQRVAQWSLFCQVTSWFTFYCATRTLTNSMETVLTTMALYYFPWPGKARQAQWKYISLVGLAVVVRPTAAIVWLPLCAWHVYMYRHIAWRVVKLFAERGFIILTLSSCLDRIFYGRWVYVHYNFLQFNVLANMGAFYGSHPWHWYLTQGFAVIMGTHVFLFLPAVRNGMEKVFLSVIFWTVAVYSVLEHKEFRFLFPVLPMCMHVCAKYIHSICDEQEEEWEEVEEAEDSIENDEHNQQKADKNEPTLSLPSYRTRKTVVILFLILSNVPLALYTGLIHQRGTVDVMRYIHRQAVERGDDHTNILFLMPCHSTPYYGYIHRNISMRFLNCDPNISGSSEYKEEAAIFYQDPEAWLKEEYPYRTDQLPTHLILFNVLEEKIHNFLEQYNYADCMKIFHTHFPEGRVGREVLVKCQKSQMPGFNKWSQDRTKKDNSDHMSKKSKKPKKKMKTQGL